MSQDPLTDVELRGLKKVPNPINIRRICEKDFVNTPDLKALVNDAKIRKSHEVSVWRQTLSGWKAGGKIGFDTPKAANVNVNANLNVGDSTEVLFSDSSVEMISAYDDVADVVISKKKETNKRIIRKGGREDPSCVDLIIRYSKANHIIFIAQAAIQAKHYKLEEGQASNFQGGAGGCWKLFEWAGFCAKGEGEKQDAFNAKTRSEDNFVTVALVPADIRPDEQLLKVSGVTGSSGAKIASSER